MIDRQNHPVGWNVLLDELSDAHEHLGKLLKDMSADTSYSEVEFRTDLGHVYAHLNRAWYQRNLQEYFPVTAWEMASRFPDDLEPIG